MSETESKAVAKVAVTHGGQVAAFVPQSMDEAWRLAGALSASGMTPKAYNNDQSRIMVGIMAGAELGLTPFAALQSIAVIGNNPAVWGDGMLALIEASGKMEDIEETDDGETATCRVVRIGRKTPIIRTFSVEDSKKAGLAGKAGPWTQHPKRMRQMRARAFALRDGFSDVLRGMKMVEEVRDYAPIGGGQMPTAKALTAASLIEQATASVTVEVIEPETGEIIQVVQEGRADEQHGDQHDGEEFAEVETESMWAIAVRKAKSGAAAAKTIAEIKAVERDWLNARVAVENEDGGEKIAREVDAMINVARKALTA